ncbi:MAG: succinate dehydrogenase assembly factor 2 [Rhodoblastus sp.]|nr:succinate dehydrogenase assembly factor 2 [Rhodoblastus sp.]
MTADDLDTRRRAIKIRAWRRGMREMDILIGGFVDARLDTLSEAEISDLERLMDVEDQKAFSWLCGTEEPEPGHDTPLFRQIKQFHSHSGPVNV